MNERFSYSPDQGNNQHIGGAFIHSGELTNFRTTPRLDRGGVMDTMDGVGNPEGQPQKQPEQLGREQALQIIAAVKLIRESGVSPYANATLPQLEAAYIDLKRKQSLFGLLDSVTGQQAEQDATSLTELVLEQYKNKGGNRDELITTAINKLAHAAENPQDTQASETPRQVEDDDDDYDIDADSEEWESKRRVKLMQLFTSMGDSPKNAKKKTDAIIENEQKGLQKEKVLKAGRSSRGGAAGRGMSKEEQKEYLIDMYIDERGVRSYEDLSDEDKERIDEFKPPEGVDLNMPRSIQEVGRAIMRKEGGRFLNDWAIVTINEETGKEVFHEENFIRWIRYKTMEHHNLNPDGTTDYFSQIRVKLGYYQQNFNIIDMVLEPNVFFKDRNSKETRSNLAGRVLGEIFGWSTGRNNGVEYRFNRGNDEKVAEVLTRLFDKSVYTNTNILESLLRMNSTKEEEEKRVRRTELLRDIGKTDEDYDNKDLDPDKEKNKEIRKRIDDEVDKLGGRAGKAFRAATMMYYYLSDPEMLRKFAVDNPDKLSFLFSNRGFADAFANARHDRDKDIRGNETAKQEEDKKDEHRDHINDLFVNHEDPAKFFDANGNIKQGMEEDWAEYINIFKEPNTDPRVLEEVKERIRMTLVEQYDIDYLDSEYIETLAWNNAWWTGSVAHNDTHNRCHDAWSRFTNTAGYRIRSTDQDSGGQIGNPFTLYGLKRLSTDFFTGITTLDGRTILEVFQGGQGSEVDIHRDVRFTPIIKNKEKGEVEYGPDGKPKLKMVSLRFGNETLNKFAVDHVARTSDIYHRIMESQDMNLDQYQKWGGYLQGWVFDHAKAEKDLKDGLWKQIKYGYRTWAGIDYSKMVRVWEHDEVDKTIMHRRDMTVAEMMFGKQVLQKYWDKNGNVDRDKIRHMQYNRAERRVFWKEIVTYLMETEVYRHRVRGSGAEYYDLYKMSAIRKFLENIHGEIEGTEANYKETQVKNWFFSNETLNRIWKNTMSRRRDLYPMQIGSEAIVGAGSGIFKTAGFLVKNIFEIGELATGK